MQGCLETLGHSKRIIIELQHIESLECKYNVHFFQNNGADGDYSFVKSSL